METHCLRHTEFPGTSRLFADFQYHFDRLSRFYAHPPYDPDSYARAASEIDYPDTRRQALVTAIARTNPASPALDLLAKPGTVAVVTGQQVGLFSGPAYTIYKALTAARLARDLTARGIPAVPVFWLATEDHDFAEVNHCRVFSPGYRPSEVRAEAVASQQPVGTIALPNPPLGALAEALEGFPYGGEISSLAAECYQPGATLGAAFRHLLQQLLADFNLLYLDPLEPSLRDIAGPFLAQALAAAPSLNAALLDRGRDLEQSGYHSQVLVEPETSLFFRLEDGHRIPLRVRNGGYASKARSYSVEELAASPERLSPNALLRPVMQDYLLPTVAYVGGPAELAYLAQSEVVYRQLLHRMPVAVARSGFTVVDERSFEKMREYGMGLPAFFAPGETVRERIARHLVPPSLLGHYSEARQSQKALLESLGAETARFDPTLGKAARTGLGKIEYQLLKLERKVAREALRRDERARTQADSLINLLYPAKHAQERYYSILPFLAQHGPQLLHALDASIHLDCPDHKLLVV